MEEDTHFLPEDYDDDPGPSAAEQLQVIQSITLARIYDMLLLIYGKVAGKDEMLKVAKAHEQGRFIGPDPALSEPGGE